MCETTDRIERTPKLMRDLLRVTLAWQRVEKRVQEVIEALRKGDDDDGSLTYA